MTILATHHTATGAPVTVTEILDPARWVVRCDACNLRNEPSQYFAHEDAEDAAEHHAKTCTEQPATVEANTCPGADQLRALIRKARPGITRDEAHFNGQRFRSELAIAEGMTAEAWNSWLHTIVGRCLVVHLGHDGRPLPRNIPTFATPAVAADCLAEDSNAIVIADWTIPAKTDSLDEGQPQAAHGHGQDSETGAGR
jgi:hypothetical protein